MITISPAALQKIHNIQTDTNVMPGVPLRVGVVSGGCSGLTYQLDFDNNFSPEANAQDKMFEVEGLKLVVDMRSFLYLAGTELDYTEGLQGKGFHFRNPNASRTCSCGESFSV